MRLIERQKNIEQDKNIKEENIEQLWLFRNISFNIQIFLRMTNEMKVFQVFGNEKP